MKHLYNLKQIKVIILIFLPIISFGQKDTTEFNVGKKKLIIIDKKTQKENAIYNLEKGKESFEKEIAEVEEDIKKHKALISKIEKKIDSLSYVSQKIANEEIANTSNNKTDLDSIIDKKISELLLEKELKKLETELEKEKLLIELNHKKEEAFREGIADIEKGIKDIKKELENTENYYSEDIEKSNQKNIRIENRNNSKFNAHWAGFELGILNFLNAKRQFSDARDLGFMVIIPEKTMSYGLNIFEYDVSLNKKGQFGVATGAGLLWNSMALKQNINLIEDENGVIQAEYVDPNTIHFTKNKFNAVYITVPLIFEIQIPVKHRKLYFGAGITGGMRAWSKQKQKYSVNGQTYKNKKTDDFQLSSFRYGATARIGYGDIGIFVNYSLVPLFKNGAGPEMYPVSAGIKIADF